MQKRLFISLPVDTGWKKTLEDSLKNHASNEWLRFTKSEDLHITCFFLGNVDEEFIPEIEDALSDIASIQNNFTLTLNKICYAPEGENRPTMIWAKLGDDMQFKILAGRVREELTYILGSTEEPEQIAHITLARFNKNVTPPKELEPLGKFGFEGKKISINELRLIESKMTKTGSVLAEISNHSFGEDLTEAVDA